MIKVFNTKIPFIQIPMFVRFALGWVLIVTSCKEPYNPPIINNGKQLLVVEGFINSKDSSSFKLSRTVNLSSVEIFNPVEGAIIEIQREDLAIIPLIDVGNGNYKSAHGFLDLTKKYRLSISLKEGSKYLSEFVEVKNAPPIDTIELDPQADELHLLISTHDDANKSRFYKWEFIDTWSYHSYFYSSLTFHDSTYSNRSAAEQIYQCWRTDSLTSFMVGSSGVLQSDKIYKLSVHQIPAASEKLSYQMSFYVRQFALTDEAYLYWENIRKMTQMMGSIFDSQPSQLSGNIKNVNDPNELVIGYISAGSFTEKRLFVEKRTLPYSFPLDQSCKDEVQMDTLKAAPVALFRANYYIPLQFLRDPSGKTAVQFAIVNCVDCRTKGGTNQKPSYWPY